MSFGEKDKFLTRGMLIVEQGGLSYKAESSYKMWTM